MLYSLFHKILTFWTKQISTYYCYNPTHCVRRMSRFIRLTELTFNCHYKSHIKTLRSKWVLAQFAKAVSGKLKMVRSQWDTIPILVGSDRYRPNPAILTRCTLNNFPNWSLLFCCYLNFYTTNFVDIFSVLYRRMFR